MSTSLRPMDVAARKEMAGERVPEMADRVAYLCRKRRSASRVSCSACLVTRAFVAR